MVNEQKEDCFLCNLFPFVRGTSKTPSIVEDPRETASCSVVSGITEIEDYEKTNMDFATADYRGFVFAIHPDHGYMLLHCTRKKKKPNHFQLPGGHIDDFEFKEAAKVTSDPLHQLLLAGKMGAARELFEETSLDIRNSLERLVPTKLYKKEKKDKLSNEYKNRLFYTLKLRDDDFLTGDKMSISDAAFLQKAMGAQPPNLKVCSTCKTTPFCLQGFDSVLSISSPQCLDCSITAAEIICRTSGICIREVSGCGDDIAAASQWWKGVNRSKHGYSNRRGKALRLLWLN